MAAAIGLATAAFSDRGGVSGGCYVDDFVTIGQPSCNAATTLFGPEPVVIEDHLEAAALVDEPVAASDVVPANEASAPAVPESLPQLRLGEPFTLPAAGLGSEQGRVAVQIGAVVLECPVTAWTAAGLAATLPAMAVAGPAKADLLVALADGTLAAVRAAAAVRGGDGLHGRAQPPVGDRQQLPPAADSRRLRRESRSGHRPRRPSARAAAAAKPLLRRAALAIHQRERV